MKPKLTHDQISKGIYYALHLRLLALAPARYVDPFAYASDSAGYKAAIAAIENPFRIFGAGGPESRDTREDSSIYIGKIETEPASNLGMSKHAKYIKYQDAGADKFRKEIDPNTTWNSYYEITYFSTKESDAAIIDQAILEAFGSRVRLHAKNADRSDAGLFVFVRASSTDTSDDEFIERQYRHYAEQVDLIGATVERSDIVPFTEFEITANPENQQAEPGDQDLSLDITFQE